MSDAGPGRQASAVPVDPVVLPAAELDPELCPVAPLLPRAPPPVVLALVVAPAVLVPGLVEVHKDELKPCSPETSWQQPPRDTTSKPQAIAREIRLTSLTLDRAVRRALREARPRQEQTALP
jgi:hypothetical protein